MFDESKHLRDEDGKFTDGNGGKTYGKEYDKRIAEARKEYEEAKTSEQKRAEAEQIYNSEQTGSTGPSNKKMTPAEKIASVHIDFDKDNILPELNEEDLPKIGAKKNKPVLLKKGVINRNERRHSEVMKDTEFILKNALYSPSEVFRGNKDKPYYTFVKPMKVSSRNGLDEYGIALLDVDENKDNFEVVHWHWVNEENIKKIKLWKNL